VKHAKNVTPSEAKDLTFGFTSPNNREIPQSEPEWLICGARDDSVE